MEGITVTVDEKKKTLTIVAPIADPAPLSKSGKTKLVVTTAGSAKTGTKVGGQELILNLNAYVYAQPKE